MGKHCWSSDSPEQLIFAESIKRLWLVGVRKVGDTHRSHGSEGKSELEAELGQNVCHHPHCGAALLQPVITWKTGGESKSQVWD